MKRAEMLEAIADALGRLGIEARIEGDPEMGNEEIFVPLKDSRGFVIRVHEQDCG